jgi:glycosyltransferase involved in cell wall biosynthesis
MRALFISHNGMAEPLGQSQVLPYLAGLARAGVEVEVLSFERADAPRVALDAVAARMRTAGLAWRPLARSVASHTLGRKAWEAGAGVLHALRAALARRPDIVHARSYLPAAVADLVATVVPRARLLFDCRGMLGDEYVDAGHWRAGEPRYRLLKRVERRLFHRADGLVVLTEALRCWLTERALLGPRVRLEVVPCCVDTDRFRPDPAARAAWRATLGLGDRLAVVYAGSLGGWYLDREMVGFVAALARRRGDVTLVVLSRDDPAGLHAAARDAGLDPARLIVRAVSPAEMPAALAAGDLGLSFIRPCFSKMGSSPTKLAEYLGAGLPVVANPGVGDVGDLAGETNACVLVQGLDAAALDDAVLPALSLATQPYAVRAAATHAVAMARFSLEGLGVPRYVALYRALGAA